jgi:hypothetical protein
MADHFDAGKFGAIVPFTFYVQNATTNGSNTDLNLTADIKTPTMPYGGSVVGISVGSSANLTAGTATFKVHKASTEYADADAPAVVLNATNSNATYGTVRPGVLKFAAGEKVGVSVSTSTDMDPTNSNDFAAVLWVQLNAV